MKIKTAMITGGCRGIGLAVSRQLVREGYNVSIMGTSRGEKVQPVIDELRQKGKVLYTVGDISLGGDRMSFLDATLARFGSVDLLVNNAGVAPEVRADLLDVSEESYDRVMTINLKGPFFLSQIVARQMLRQTQARQTKVSQTGEHVPETAGNNAGSSAARDAEINGLIINISSVSADIISLNRGEYCLSKTGMSMMTRLFAARLAGSGVLVYEIKPGIIETDMTAGVRQKYDQLIEQGQFPIARWGQPEDLAEAVSLLISGKLRYSTGDCLHVDGGYHIRQL